MCEQVFLHIDHNIEKIEGWYVAGAFGILAFERFLGMLFVEIVQ